MFMELRNTWQLTRMQYAYNRKTLWMMFAVPAAAGVMALLGTLSGILTQPVREGPALVTFIDMTAFFFIGMLAGQAINAVLYRSAHNRTALYPQTDLSRFLSTYIIQAAIISLFLISMLAMYLLQAGVITAVASARPYVYMAAGFDWAHTMRTFAALCLYVFLGNALIQLAAALFRLSWLWTSAAGIVLGVVALAGEGTSWLMRQIVIAVELFTKEPSFPAFLLKVCLAWLALSALTLLAVRFTRFHKSARHLSPKTIISIVAGVAVATVLLSGLMMRLSPGTVISPFGTGSSNYMSHPGDIVVFLDVSHLPVGTPLKLEGENVWLPIVGEREWEYKFNNQSRPAMSDFNLNYNSLSGEILTVPQSGRLILRYTLTTMVRDGYVISDYVNQRVEAYVDGDTVHINFLFDKGVRVVDLPFLRFIRQFGPPSGYDPEHRNSFSTWPGQVSILPPTLHVVPTQP